MQNGIRKLKLTLTLTLTITDTGGAVLTLMMIGLPYGGKTMTICSAVFIQYQRVTDKRTDGRTDGQNYYINIARQQQYANAR